MKKMTTIIRCDGNGCKTVEEIPDKNIYPDHWYHIQQVDSAGRLKQDGFDLCGLKCVEKWAKGRRQTEIDNSHHEYICDVPGCDLTFPTLEAVGMHKHRFHQ